MRKDILLQYIKDVAPGTKNWLMGDYPMWLYFIHVSKVKFFDEITGVYRVLENSASHSTNVLKQINFLKFYKIFASRRRINRGMIRCSFRCSVRKKVKQKGLINQINPFSYHQ